MNEHVKAAQSRLLRRYYKSAALGWLRPTSLHWAKMVDAEGRWRWTRADLGIKGRLLRNAPLHVYQTVMRFKTDSMLSDHQEGWFLGGPLVFDADKIDVASPFQLWRIADCASNVQELIETLRDRNDYRILRVMFSGLRGLHVLAERLDHASEPIPLCRQSQQFNELRKERMQVARAIGYWCKDWDWRVTADIYRVARVPWSIHGKSGLRALILHPPYTMESFRGQLRYACPFSFDRQLRIRITRAIPSFTFTDAQMYGPYRKGWVTRLPLAVAAHLIWREMAKPREDGPWSSSSWFEKGWQTLFRAGSTNRIMSSNAKGEDAS
jgi:hypothetical protein